MKALKLLGTLLMVVVLVVVLARCSDEEPLPDPTYTISGMSTYPDFNGSTQPASGGLVYLVYGTEASTNWDEVAVVDANGNYSFSGLQPGDYFVFCVFDNKNTNLPEARVDRVIFTDEGAGISILDKDIIQDFQFESRGQADAMAVDVTDNGDWRFDKSHSNVDFEFPYDEHNGLYTGRFSGFDITTVFDPSDLANSSLSATVDLLTINTSSPGGRDPLYNADGSFYENQDGSNSLGCISGYFGIDGTTSANREATFESVSIQEYGDGYLAKGEMTFRGVTGDVNFYFEFQPGYQAPNRQQVMTQFSSFEGYFDFAAKEVWGLTSGHVGDAMVTIRVTQQVTKPLE